MNTTLQSAESLHPVRPSPAAARRGQATGANAFETETYGGEKLPVLIRLPDLTRAAILPMPSVEVVESGATAPCELASAPTLEPEGEQTGGGTSAGKLRQQRRVRTRDRAISRSASTGWLRGLGQLAMAAILAGVLLVVIITIKHWNADNAKSKPPVGVPFADAPDFEITRPVVESPVKTNTDQGSNHGLPSLGSPSGTVRGALPADVSSPAYSNDALPPTTPRSDSTVTRRAGGLEVPRSAATDSPLTGVYPSTGVAEPEPMAPRAGSLGAPTTGDAAGWSMTMPVGRVNNAARPSVDSGGQRR